MKKHILYFAVIIGFIIAQPTKSQETDEFYYSKQVLGDFIEISDKVKALLADQGFGIISEIDMHLLLNDKIDGANIKPYKVIGACNPIFAHDAIHIEGNVGLFLPCKILIKELDNKHVEVIIVKPQALFELFENQDLNSVATEIDNRFNVILGKL